MRMTRDTHPVYFKAFDLLMQEGVWKRETDEVGGEYLKPQPEHLECLKSLKREIDGSIKEIEAAE